MFYLCKKKGYIILVQCFSNLSIMLAVMWLHLQLEVLVSSEWNWAEFGTSVNLIIIKVDREVDKKTYLHSMNYNNV